MSQQIHCTYTSRGGASHSKLLLAFTSESDSLAGHIVTRLKNRAEQLWGSGAPTFMAIHDETLPAQSVPIADTVEGAVMVAFDRVMDLMALEHG